MGLAEGWQTMARQAVLGFPRAFQRVLGCVFLACALLAIGAFAAPSQAFAQDFTPNARLDDNGVLHWDAEGEYYSRIDLSLLFGPNSADHCMPSVDGEYTYDIEGLFQTAEQFYGGIGTGDVSGLNGDHPVTFVYYEKQADGTMQEVGRAENAYSYSYATGRLVQLATPDNLSWTGNDGFTASWDSVEHAEGYLVRFYETASGSTSKVGEANVESATCELTSAVPTPKDGATYAFEVRALRPADEPQYVNSDWSTRSAASAAWQTPVVEYGLSVGGVDVTSENAMDVLGNGSVSYDPDSQTLTLENAKITNTGDSGAAIKRVAHKGLDSLTIELVGINSCGSIVIGGGTSDLCPLTISGKGSLTVSETAVAGAISAQGDITVDGATLTVNTREGGIQSNLGDIIIKNAIVDLDALTSNAYYCLMAHSIRIENSTVDAFSEGVDSNPLLASDSLSIEGSTVTVTAESAINPAIWAPNIEVTDGSDVTVIGNESNAVYSRGTITVDGSSFQVEGMSPDALPALYALGDINVKSSTVTAESAGMRGIFTDADMTISDNSTVTASGTTQEGMVVVGALTVENSTLRASTSSDNEMKPAFVTEQLSVVASEVTLEGGLDLSGWYDLSTDNAELVIEPGADELVEFKVDAQNRDGSAAAHFREEGSDSPYDARVELTEAQMNWLGAYRYIHIGEHVHEGGTATCSAGAVCDDCGREYGAVDPNAHSFTHYVSNNDATCTKDGTETATCDNGCGATDTRVVQGSALGHDPELVDAKPATCTDAGYSGDEVCKRCGELLKQGAAIPALGHTLENGVCTVCGEKDPDYVDPDEPENPDDSGNQDPDQPTEPGDQDPDQPTGPSAEEGSTGAAIPATGDASALFSLVPALLGGSALAAGVIARRRR